MTERFTGHGAEWRDSNLTPTEAKLATCACACTPASVRPATARSFQER